MLSFLGELLQGILGFLGSFLPDSPVQDWIDSVEMLQQGLAWLNWIFPVGDCLAFFVLFLGLLVVWAAVRFAVGKATGIADKLVG